MTKVYPRVVYYREVFFAHNGPGPYQCCFCDGEVLFEAVAIHHHDEDHDNNVPLNLMPAHGGCHKSHHAKKRPRSAEERMKISEALTGRGLSDEHKASISASLKGRKFTDEHRAAISRANTGRKFTDEHRAAISLARRGLPQERPAESSQNQ